MDLLTRRYTLKLGLFAGTGLLIAAADNALAQAMTQTTETKDMTMQMVSDRTDYPPFIPAPKDATPVIVTVELIAKDPDVLERHLISAGVIPTTRLASGINYSWTVREQNNPNRFFLIQQWNSVAQQQGYIAWRNEQGNLAELRALLAKDPIVTYLSPIDMTTLPSQVG